MQIFELTARLSAVQRSQGRSSTAAAAYRAAERIEDEQTGLVHDFRRKGGVKETALLLPANAPEYAHDRARLFNAIEAAEKHPRACVARDLTIAFPAGFNETQQREAGMRVGLYIVSRFGVAVDIAWHEPNRKGSEMNHHAHLLFATRRWDENGQWAKTKDRMLDDRVQGPEEVRKLRRAVADVFNDIAERDGIPVYTEHQSFETRGLEQQPTQHMGPTATKLEREGVATRIGDKNRQIRTSNAELQELNEHCKVIDFELARRKLAVAKEEADRRKAAALLENLHRSEPYQAFYQQAMEDRAQLRRTLDERYQAQEGQLKSEVASLTAAQQNANFIQRFWRRITGRAKAEQEQIARAALQLEEIQRRRQIEYENLEKDRLQRLDLLKAQELQRQAEREQAVAELARPHAVGERNPAQARREYFRNKAVRENQAESRRAPTDSPALPSDNTAQRRRRAVTRDPEPDTGPEIDEGPERF